MAWNREVWNWKLLVTMIDSEFHKDIPCERFSWISSSHHPLWHPLHCFLSLPLVSSWVWPRLVSFPFSWQLAVARPQTCKSVGERNTFIQKYCHTWKIRRCIPVLGEYSPKFAYSPPCFLPSAFRNHSFGFSWDPLKKKDLDNKNSSKTVSKFKDFKQKSWLKTLMLGQNTEVSDGVRANFHSDGVCFWKLTTIKIFKKSKLAFSM